MKVVNPKEGKCPDIRVNEPFMLWCPVANGYYRTIIRIWLGGDRYVIRDTQGLTTIAAFCIAKSPGGTDLFDTASEAIEVVLQGNYKFYYTRA